MTTKVLIATPVYGDVVTIHYMNSILALFEAFRQRGGITGARYFLSSSVVSRSRNAYASAVLNDPSFTHLLFIDSDMGFRPEAVMRLLDFGKPYSGCLCPYRAMDFGRYHAVARAVDDPQLARSVAQGYVCSDRLIHEQQDGKLRVKLDRGFARTARLGAALTLLKREVLDQMAERYPELLTTPDTGYQGMGVRGRLFQCFESLQTPEGLFLSEDMSFARRWTEGCGGEIWACVDEQITHAGQMAFTGRAADRLAFEGTIDR